MYKCWITEEIWRCIQETIPIENVIMMRSFTIGGEYIIICFATISVVLAIYLCAWSWVKYRRKEI